MSKTDAQQGNPADVLQPPLISALGRRYKQSSERTMINLIFNFVILVILSMMAASLFLKVTGLTFWWSALFLGTLGVLLYFCNAYLIRHFIKKKAPGVLELDAAYGKPMKDGEYLWEKTAGSGIVPKWVSWIGIASYACFAGIVIWLIIWLT